MKISVKILSVSAAFSLFIALFVSFASSSVSYAGGSNRSTRNSEDESSRRSTNDVSMAVLGIGNFSHSVQLISAPGNSTSTGNTPTFSAGAGLAFDFPISSSVSFEAGTFYLQRQTLAFDSSSNSNTRWLELAPLLKLWPVAGIISVGAGPYYSRKLGNTAPGSGLSPAIYNKDEVGAFASLGLNIPLVHGLAFTTEGRYSLALTNTYNEKEVARQLVANGADARETVQTSFEQKHSEAQVLAGFRFEI